MLYLSRALSSYLDDVGNILWLFGFEEDPYATRNENHDQRYHNAFVGHLVLKIPIIDPFGVDVQEERHHAQGSEGGAGGHHNAEWKITRRTKKNQLDV